MKLGSDHKVQKEKRPPLTVNYRVLTLYVSCVLESTRDLLRYQLLQHWTHLVRRSGFITHPPCLVSKQYIWRRTFM